MTSNHRNKRMNRVSRPLPKQLSRADATRKLGLLLSTTMQPIETGEPWITAEDVAKRVSQRRRRRCSVQEVTAALQGDSVPAVDIVSAAIELRAEQRGVNVQSSAVRRRQAEDERLILEALSNQEIFDKAQPHRIKSFTNIIGKKTAWAIGVITTAVLTLLVTGVIPGILGQLFNGPAIADRFRSGPAIIASESIVYVNGPDVPVPSVIPEEYRPSSALIRAIARPRGAGSPALLQELHAHGVVVGQISIRLILQGNRNDPIRILNIHPVQLRRTPPLDGDLFSITSEGQEDDIRMGFNVDQPAPQAVVTDRIGTLTKELYFTAHSISLHKGEQVVLIIQAAAQCLSARFNLGIDYTVGSAPKTEIVSNNGRPFQVTGGRFANNNVISYRRIFRLRSDFSVTQMSPREIQTIHRTAEEAKSCSSLQP